MPRPEPIRESLRVRFRPTTDLWALLVSWILVTGSLASATYLVGADNGGGYFIVYGIVTALVFGMGIPVWWMVWHRGRSIAELGITTNHLGVSIGLQLVLAAVQYWQTLARTGVPQNLRFLPLVALALCIGLFEAVFWRGWMLMRLEESFGFPPALVASSGAYALYHVGYGMPWGEMVFLFFIGVMYACIFRVTGSVFILWPVLQPMGQLVTLLKDGGLELPQIAALGFGEVLIAMLVLLFIASRHARKSASADGPRTRIRGTASSTPEPTH